MADIYNISIVLTTIGQDLGPFNVYLSSDGGSSYSLYQSSVPRSSFVGGYFLAGIPESACYVKIESVGNCSVILEMPVTGYPLPCP